MRNKVPLVGFWEQDGEKMDNREKTRIGLWGQRYTNATRNHENSSIPENFFLDTNKDSSKWSSLSSSSAAAAVHIVYTEKPQDEQPEAYHIRTLSSVLGSEEAAKEALIYSYKTAASGFSAKLTPEQVAEISKQPGVLQVVPSRTLQLHSTPGQLH
ncbi:Xylem serine proteinase 1 [Theobroma cacao]|uniref:Xylem serine proteinase 1 n=1 Tax=Theobroma cacao TaxID=3641 RepID=A0A061FKP0_THECC|nr:Xylem serine proteinase 1 [Theobroma cacao]